jgi:hypothetical protein
VAFLAKGGLFAPIAKADEYQLKVTFQHSVDYFCRLIFFHPLFLRKSNIIKAFYEVQRIIFRVAKTIADSQRRYLHQPRAAHSGRFSFYHKKEPVDHCGNRP